MTRLETPATGMFSHLVNDPSSYVGLPNTFGGYDETPEVTASHLKVCKCVCVCVCVCVFIEMEGFENVCKVYSVSHHNLL